MSSIFSKIIAGEIPSYKIAEDDRFFAFLDINPMKEGHTLVIPKTEVDYIFDLDDDLLADMMIFAKKVSTGIKATIPCNRVGIIVLGLDVPHAHIHLIPINTGADLSLANPKLKLHNDEFEKIAIDIRKNISM